MHPDRSKLWNSARDSVEQMESHYDVPLVSIPAMRSAPFTRKKTTTNNITFVISGGRMIPSCRSLSSPILEEGIASPLESAGWITIGTKTMCRNKSKVFRKQLALAQKVGLLLLLHCRNAHEDFMNILKPFLGCVKAVVHCHTDPSIRNTKELVDAACYIGSSGIVCDERPGRFNPDIVQYIPEDRLIVESDSPFLIPRTTPSGKRDQHRSNEPCLVPFVVRRISHLTGRSELEIAHKSAEVAKEFFRLE